VLTAPRKIAVAERIGGWWPVVALAVAAAAAAAGGCPDGPAHPRAWPW